MSTKIKKNLIYKQSNGTINKDPSMVQKQFAEESDINNIMAKYVKTGLLPNVRDQLAQYADVSSGYSFEEAADKVKRMNTLYNQLPASVRDVLRSPEEFYSSFHSDQGRRILESLDVIKKKAVVSEAATAAGVSGGKAPAKEKAEKAE